MHSKTSPQAWQADWNSPDIALVNEIPWGESVTETVRCGWLLKLPGKLEDLVYFPPPGVRYRFETVGLTDNERPDAKTLCTGHETFPEPVGNVREDLAAVLLRSQKNFITLEPVH